MKKRSSNSVYNFFINKASITTFIVVCILLFLMFAFDFITLEGPVDFFIGFVRVQLVFIILVCMIRGIILLAFKLLCKIVIFSRKYFPLVYSSVPGKKALLDYFRIKETSDLSIPDESIVKNDDIVPVSGEIIAQNNAVVPECCIVTEPNSEIENIPVPKQSSSKRRKHFSKDYIEIYARTCAAQARKELKQEVFSKDYINSELHDIPVIPFESVPSSNSHDSSFDNMSGLEFENFCADILKKNHFVNVSVTQGSGDYGIDILAEKDDITYAIQCKCYSSPVGNSAVQQANTGKAFYGKDIAVVLTNNFFTEQAVQEASAVGVKLWDRSKLLEFYHNSIEN